MIWEYFGKINCSKSVDVLICGRQKRYFDYFPVLRTRFRRDRMFLGILDPDPNPLVICTDPDPARIQILLSSSKISKKNLDSYSFVTFFDFLSLKNDVNIPFKK